VKKGGAAAASSCSAVTLRVLTVWLAAAWRLKQRRNGGGDHLAGGGAEATRLRGGEQEAFAGENSPAISSLFSLRLIPYSSLLVSPLPDEDCGKEYCVRCLTGKKKSGKECLWRLTEKIGAEGMVAACIGWRRGELHLPKTLGATDCAVPC